MPGASPFGFTPVSEGLLPSRTALSVSRDHGPVILGAPARSSSSGSEPRHGCHHSNVRSRFGRGAWCGSAIPTVCRHGAMPAGQPRQGGRVRLVCLNPPVPVPIRCPGGLALGVGKGCRSRCRLWKGVATVCRNPGFSGPILHFQCCLVVYNGESDRDGTGRSPSAGAGSTDQCPSLPHPI